MKAFGRRTLRPKAAGPPPPSAPGDVYHEQQRSLLLTIQAPERQRAGACRFPGGSAPAPSALAGPTSLSANAAGVPQGSRSGAWPSGCSLLPTCRRPRARTTISCVIAFAGRTKKGGYTFVEGFGPRGAKSADARAINSVREVQAPSPGVPFDLFGVQVEPREVRPESISLEVVKPAAERQIPVTLYYGYNVYVTVTH